MSEQFDKLAQKLSHLFELEKADLDFGIHRIIKARQKHIRIFLGQELPPTDDPGAPTLEKIVQRELGEANTAELEASRSSVVEDIRAEYGSRAFNDAGQLVSDDAQSSPTGPVVAHPHRTAHNRFRRGQCPARS